MTRKRFFFVPKCQKSLEDLKMRKLAVIDRIKAIKSIIKADNLEAVIVKGWTVVVKKGEFQVGDLVVYCEIDSFLPLRSQFEFLRASSYRKMGEKEGFRIRTAKLRGQLSQGIVFSISLFPELKEIDRKIDTDVTELLGITKYETPIPLSLTGEIMGSFPSRIKKTDQERIQVRLVSSRSA
jgi:RNA ligase (TIGR02306 family)